MSSVSHTSDRHPPALRCIEPARQSGLEFGPLASPLVRRTDGDIQYIDVAATEELRAKYRGHSNVDVEHIEHVDYVWTDGPLREVVGPDTEFDYVIAAHVIEHVPDPIWWLQEVHSVLRDGGVLILVVPDRRFTFDYLRPESTVGQLVESYLTHVRKPSPQQIYDHHAYYVVLTAAEAWSPEFDPAQLQRFHRDPMPALELCLESLATGDYIDTHCHVFTPASFLDALEHMVFLHLLQFVVHSFFPTERGQNQFFAVLQRSDSPTDFVQRQLSSIQAARALLGPTAGANQSHAKPTNLRELWRALQSRL